MRALLPWVSAVVFTLHAIASGVGLALLPHGFSWSDGHAWTNGVIPACTLICASLASIDLVRTRSRSLIAPLLVAAIAGGWVGAIVAGKALFPVSITWGRALAVAPVALVLSGLAWRVRRSVFLSVGALAIGLATGAFVVTTQRAPVPGTRPLGAELVEARGEVSSISEDASRAAIDVACGGSRVRVAPLLTFVSRSPDRTWTLLAPPSAFGDRRRATRFEPTAQGFRANYEDDGESSFDVEREGDTLRLDAVSVLPTPVYAHLDSWASITFVGGGAISFGPVATSFDIVEADYPSGRPIQLATLGSDDVLRVWRAADADKGPFTELGSGHLASGDALTIDLRPEKGADGCRFEFTDWSAQVSRAPSPTAGWGLPANSISFFSRAGVATIVLTLADTGPGRGFESVGHAAGTYRDRITVRPLPAGR